MNRALVLLPLVSLPLVWLLLGGSALARDPAQASSAETRASKTRVAARPRQDSDAVQQSQQGPARSAIARIASYVVDAQGRPAAGARVYLVGLVGKNRLPVEHYQSQQVVADENGRFEAEVRRSSKYLAWSSRKLDDASFAVSAAVELSCASEVVLHEGATQRPRRLELVGRKSWRALGAVRFEIWVQHGDAVAPLPWRRRRRGGALLVPPAPHVLSKKLLLVAYGEQGEEILRHGLRFREGLERVELLAPRKLTVRARGAGGDFVVLRGQPANFNWGRSRTIRRVIGRATASAPCEYLVARWRTSRGVQPRELQLSALANGRAECSKDVELEDEETWDPVEFDLDAGFVARGRVLVRKGASCQAARAARLCQVRGGALGALVRTAAAQDPGGRELRVAGARRRSHDHARRAPRPGAASTLGEGR